jgi:hypothetical protein
VEFSKEAKENVGNYGQNMILKLKVEPEVNYGIFELNGGALKLIKIIRSRDAVNGFADLNFVCDLMKDGSPGLSIRKPTIAIVSEDKIASIEKRFMSEKLKYTDIPVTDDPYDPSVNDQIAPDSHSMSYGSAPGIVIMTHQKLLTAAYSSGEFMSVYEMDQNFSLIRKINLRKKMPIFCGFTRDPEGNFYFAYGMNNKDGDMTSNVCLVRYNDQGEETGMFSLPTDNESGYDVMLPVSNATGRVLYADGMVAVHMGKTQHKNKKDGLNHQSGILFIVDVKTMTINEKKSMKWTASHSFDQRMIFDGSSYVNLDLGDNYPRGFNLTKEKTGRVIFTFKTEHSKKESVRGGKTIPAGKWSNDNRTYSELGGLALTNEGYLILGSSEMSFDNRITGKYLNESRNLFAVLVNRDFNQKKLSVHEGKSQTNMVSDEVVVSAGEKSDIISFYTFNGDIQYQRRKGVIWLTNYNDKTKENAVRPKLIQTDKDEYLVIWEKWTDKRYYLSYYLKINSQGKILIPETDLGGVRLNRGDDPVYFDGKAVWAVGMKDRQFLRIYQLDPK